MTFIRAYSCNSVIKKVLKESIDMSFLEHLSKYVSHPLWDMKDKSVRLRVLAELEKAQWRSLDEQRDHQWKKLTHMLAYAYAHVPYYRALFDDRGITVDSIASCDDFRRIPFLEKKDVRAHQDRMFSDLHKKEDLVTAKTGGSTGVALKLFFDKECEERRNAAAIRSDRWTSWDLGKEKGALWGNPPVADSLKKKIRNRLLDRVFYLDTVGLNDASMRSFVAEIKKRNCAYLFGHAHSLFMFAEFCLASKLQCKMRGIVSTSMMLLDNERAVIERAFQCPVQDRYGCEEVSLIASECEEHAGMHINTDHVFVEIMKDDGTPAQDGEEGALVVTDLINFGMPFIRYRLGDYAVATDRLCTCGRGLPLMEKVVGRVADFLKKKDGTLVAGISLIERTLTKVAGITQLQIVQETPDTFLLNLVKDDSFSKVSEEALVSEIKAVFGDVSVLITILDAIPQERNGKYRFSICKI